MTNLISISSLTRKEIEKILQLTQEIEEKPAKYRHSLDDKALAVAFFEPSTRTRVGFSLAIQKLGGQVTELSELKYKEGMSSPESLEDTLKVVGDYADGVALRHPSEEFVKQLSIHSSLINCGNGNDEHPTQALIDLYTIWKEYKRIDNLSISLVGDLKNMRTPHSLVLALSMFDYISVNLVSPDSLRLPNRYKVGLSASETTIFNPAHEDVVYMVGFPPHPGLREDERLQYQMNGEKSRQLKENAIILCPLPRVDEITREVDRSLHAKYFGQSRAGLFVRMAVLYSLLQN